MTPPLLSDASDVEPTRSQNSTVSCRLSLCGWTRRCNVSLVGVSGSSRAGERANGFEYPLAVAEWDVERFKNHLSQIGDDLEVDGLLGKNLSVLCQSRPFEPGSRTKFSHRRFFRSRITRTDFALERIPVPTLGRAIGYRAIVFLYGAPNSCRISYLRFSVQQNRRRVQHR
jgi:hypothetical protein